MLNLYRQNRQNLQTKNLLGDDHWLIDINVNMAPFNSRGPRVLLAVPRGVGVHLTWPYRSIECIRFLFAWCLRHIEQHITARRIQITYSMRSLPVPVYLKLHIYMKTCARQIRKRVYFLWVNMQLFRDRCRYLTSRHRKFKSSYSSSPILQYKHTRDVLSLFVYLLPRNRSRCSVRAM